jgi:outer membrane receptor protein involved in Fe transport
MNLKLSAIVALALANSVSLGAAEKLTTSTINVYSASPLPSIGLPLNVVPANIQIVKSKDLNNQAGVSIADYMNNNMQGVSIAEMGGNPYQLEVNFRGYSASPLLGNAQGISVYVDGVRANEPFGDITSWDKIPNFAIKSMQMVPGSNPIYGLNTLGGAMAIQTKSGREAKGLGVEFEAGSWGRQRSLAEFGGVSKDGSVDYYFGAQHTKEDGWRKFSPTQINQTFGKVGWQNENSKINLSYMGADNKLIGNGFTPENLLSGDRDQIHTQSDITNNYSHQFTLNGEHWLNKDTLFSGTAYYKHSNRNTKNPDIWEYDLDGEDDDTDVVTDPTYTFLNCSSVDTNGGTSGLGHTGGQCEFTGAVLNRTKTKQKTYGLQGQLAFNQDLFGKKNQLVMGSVLEYTKIDFKQSALINVAQIETNGTYSTPRATVIDSGTLNVTGPLDDDGDNYYDASGNNGVFDTNRGMIFSGNGLLPETQNTGLKGKQYQVSLFANDTLSVTDQWHVNAGARLNYTKIDNVDTLRGSHATSAQSLTAKNTYMRLNPTLGLTYTPQDKMAVYTSYSESSRAPTSIELGCSNPAYPCLLPAAMADDPPLKQVVAKTYEFGSRGELTQNIRWNASIYHAMNHDDIIFKASTTRGQGYFSNVGRTKRQGIDLGLGGNIDKFSWNASYSYIRATYDNDVDFVSLSNSTAAGTGDPEGTGIINAKKGDRMPMIPDHQLKLRLQYQATPDWSFGGNLVAYSSQYVWGNENNRHQANSSSCGTTSSTAACGDGKLDAYFVVNLDTQYNIGKGWKAFAKATNIFDHEYDVAGRLAETAFTAAGVYGTETRQLGLLPGSPRAGWIGFRYEFGGEDKKD